MTVYGPAGKLAAIAVSFMTGIAVGCSGDTAATTTVTETVDENVTKAVTDTVTLTETVVEVLPAGKPVEVRVSRGYVTAPTRFAWGDGSNGVKNVRWRAYGGTRAIGQGLRRNPDCTVVGCPRGEQPWLPTTVTLTRIVVCNGHAVYARLRIAGVSPGVGPAFELDTCGGGGNNPFLDYATAFP